MWDISLVWHVASRHTCFVKVSHFRLKRTTFPSLVAELASNWILFVSINTGWVQKINFHAQTSLNVCVFGEESPPSNFQTQLLQLFSFLLLRSFRMVRVKQCTLGGIHFLTHTHNEGMRFLEVGFELYSSWSWFLSKEMSPQKYNLYSIPTRTVCCFFSFFMMDFFDWCDLHSTVPKMWHGHSG